MPEGLTLFNTLDIQFHQNKPVFQVKQAVAQSIPNNTITTLTYDTVIYDSHSGWSNSTHVYTVQVAGWYWVSMQIELDSNSTGIRTCRLNQNGTGSTILIHTMTPNAIGDSSGLYLTGPVKCAIGDTLKVELVQTSGGALGTHLIGGYNCSFSLDWMHR